MQFVCGIEGQAVSRILSLEHKDHIFSSARSLHPYWIPRLLIDANAMRPLLSSSDAMKINPFNPGLNVFSLTRRRNHNNCLVSCAYNLLHLHKTTIHVPSRPPDHVTTIPRRDDCWVVMSRLLRSKLSSVSPWMSTSGSISPSLSLSKNDCRAGEILTSVAALILTMNFTQLSDVHVAV